MKFRYNKTDKDSRLSEHLLIFAASLSIAAFLINEVHSVDIWWHIIIGEDIIEHLSVPRSDRYTASAFGRPYHDSHWLFQVLVAIAHHISGMAGVGLVMIIIWSLTLAFCYRAARRWATQTISAFLLFLTAMASIERFLPRPEIVTFLMIIIFYNLLEKTSYRNRAGLAIFGLLQIIWTNCHGLFVIGPFMAGCYWTVDIIKYLSGRSSSLRETGTLLAVIVAATLVTPFGFGGWEYAYLLFSEAGSAAPDVFKTIGEMSPTFGSAARSAPPFWFFLTLIAATAVSTAPLIYRRQLSLARTLIVAGLFAASLTARRNTALFAIVSAPFIAENLGTLFPKGIKLPRLLNYAAAAVMLVWAVYPLSGQYYLDARKNTRFGIGATPSFFPHKLPDFLDRTGFRGRIYNSNTLGGFYLYHGYPDRLPLTDGRWEIYDHSLLDSIRTAPYNFAIFDLIVSKFDIKGVLLQHASDDAKHLVPRLSKNSRWRLVYLDYAASFWIREDAANIPEEVNLFSLDAGLPSSPRRFEDIHMLDNFLMYMNADRLKLLNLKQGLSFRIKSIKTVPLLEEIGRLQMKLGQTDEAEKTYKRLAEIAPRNITALNELAFFEYSRGNLNNAAKLMRRALKYEPGNQMLIENYDKLRKALNGIAPEA